MSASASSIGEDCELFAIFYRALVMIPVSTRRERVGVPGSPAVIVY